MYWGQAQCIFTFLTYMKVGLKARGNIRSAKPRWLVHAYPNLLNNARHSSGAQVAIHQNFLNQGGNSYLEKQLPAF